MMIAILGMGTVGRGCYRALCAKGSGLTMKRFLDLRTVEGLEDMRTENINDILEDGDIEAVVETMGGVHPAYEFVLAAMRAKKHVVSSNKWLVSECWRELHQAARENGVRFLYTAAAGGGIPWLVNLSRARRCDEILSVGGIINGTTNFILDGMHARGASFEDMLREAQRLGYAEADPSADIDGIDTRRKCAISAGVAFGGYMNEADIPCMGIRTVGADELSFCEREGLVCRLMFRAEKSENGVCAYVSPVFVEKGSTAASVHGCDNYITLEGAALGKLSFIGQGAGGDPTGVAVAQDLMDIASGVPERMPESGDIRLCLDAQKEDFYIRKNGVCQVKRLSVKEAFEEGAEFFARIAR